MDGHFMKLLCRPLALVEEIHSTNLLNQSKRPSDICGASFATVSPGETGHWFRRG